MRYCSESGAYILRESDPASEPETVGSYHDGTHAEEYQR